ncbi:MAG: ATP-dependent DNA helicase RecG [Candidatus Magnetoglobus multicellularis str. Araruama]|uniref:ATP-dependent DNA helicase RecG n=1 Tax=Candidatus Magnetoglobus multicellularis str. Araruama TaxID=890399 RepID=A0A1V1P1B9_9BACT|nr:MAG: ATP-dependent DNA helicase RecG [Candidatus Magnetoglobus multicellularis str. Araruama]
MNNKIELKVLARRESERVEWKENVASIEIIVKTIVAFANDFSNLGGGYVVCGGKEGKDDYGFQKIIYTGLTANRLNEITQKVLSDCRKKVDPEIIPCIEEITIPEDPSKRILIFIVPATDHAHSYRASRKDASTYYIRSGSNTIEARNGLLRELLIRKRQLKPWDRRINPESTMNDIDLIIFREYLQEMGLWSQNKALEDYISDTEKLSDFTPPLAGKIGLDKTLRLMNFTILMFAKNPLNFFEGAYTVLSKYKGNDRSESTAQRQMITGTIVQQARKLIEQLKDESFTAFDKTTGFPNKAKFPAIAVKEAVINALVHKDYESDQPVRVTVFDSRIEFYSPGGLPIQVNKQKFVKGQATAYWRNQALNYLFNKLQLAQAEGQGIPTIFRAMKEEGCPEPIFEIDSGSLTCILPAHPRHQMIKEMDDIESKIILGDYESVIDSLEDILIQDNYNDKAWRLYCKVNKRLQTPENVLLLIKHNKIDLKKMTPGAVTVIAESLASISNQA